MTTEATTKRLKIDDSLPMWKRRLYDVLFHNKWSDDDVEKGTLEFERFMQLSRRDPTERLSPSPFVDRIWHHAILDTRYYAFGDIEHDPVSAIKDPVSVYVRYAETLRAYREVFKVAPPSPYWKSFESLLGGASASEREELRKRTPIIRVFVTTPDDKLTSAHVGAFDKVETVGLELVEATGITADAQRFFFKSKRLNSDDYLIDSGIFDQAQLHLFTAQRGC